MKHTVCLERGEAYRRLGSLIDEALGAFRFVATNLDLPVRYRVKVEIVPPVPKARELDLTHHCSRHYQFHAETVANTRPRKETLDARLSRA